jgi:neutral ceramidase
MSAPFRRTIACLLVLAPCAGSQSWGQDAATDRVFLAGAATSNITPPLGEAIVGGWNPTPATNVHDELHARCLVLDDGRTRVAFAVCDSVGIKRETFDEVRALIADETDLPPENVLFSATHTHSATRSESERYRPFLVRKIADGILRAIANLEPARIGWGGVAEPSEVFNRRWYVTDPELLKNPFGGVDEVRMNPPRGNAALVKPAGPVDPEVSFVSVRSTDGRPIALLANYSLHYVGGVGGREISADYFAIFAERIGELLAADRDGAEGFDDHPPFVGIMTNGTSADVNNINFPAKSLPRREPYEKMTEVAFKVADRVHEAHADVTFHDWVPLATTRRDLVLKVRKPDVAMQKYLAEIEAKPEDAPKFNSHERTYAERCRALLEGPDEYVVPLQAVRIGDLGIASIPFEVFTEIGLEIKQQTPFADQFTISLANGSYGYLPTPAQHEKGGYETWMGTNRVQLDASDRITENLLEMLDELKSPGE